MLSALLGQAVGASSSSSSSSRNPSSSGIPTRASMITNDINSTANSVNRHGHHGHHGHSQFTGAPLGAAPGVLPGAPGAAGAPGEFVGPSSNVASNHHHGASQHDVLLALQNMIEGGVANPAINTHPSPISMNNIAQSSLWPQEAPRQINPYSNGNGNTLLGTEASQMQLSSSSSTAGGAMNYHSTSYPFNSSLNTSINAASVPTTRIGHVSQTGSQYHGVSAANAGYSLPFLNNSTTTSSIGATSNAAVLVLPIYFIYSAMYT